MLTGDQHMNRFLVTLSVLALAATPAFARDQIRIVGSSTVYPFTTAVAENFGKASGMKTPVVESTGTGGGFKLFCAGVGVDTPDFTNASRPIKKSEFDTCQKNGVTDIVEIKVGFDGLTIANAATGPEAAFTKQQIFLALAKQVPDKDGKLIDNPYRMWNEIDPSLPDEKIEVLGPPPTSGTRDSFAELVLEKGAEKFESLAALKKSDAKAFEAVWKTIRTDGAYVEAGENDNLIVQKLEANPKAFGVFGYSFLEENQGKIKAAKVEGEAPTFESIASGTYKVARPLFIYAKKQHVGTVPGMAEFLVEFTSSKALSEDGYLADKGLIPLPEADAATTAAAAKDMITLTADKVM
jgi:phosphate transport system substrate-binding protein